MHHYETQIYRLSLELIGDVRNLIDNLPSGYAFLADQLRRASSSVSLNFAEGFAKTGPRDRRRFFNYAKGSANEVMAGVDVAHAMGLLDDEPHANMRDKADHIAAILAKFK